MIKRKCGNCRFYEDHRNQGYCHRYPPNTTLEGILVLLRYKIEDADYEVWPNTLGASLPAVFEDGWCGEFKPRGAARR